MRERNELRKGPSKRKERGVSERGQRAHVAGRKRLEKSTRQAPFTPSSCIFHERVSFSNHRLIAAASELQKCPIEVLFIARARAVIQ